MMQGPLRAAGRTAAGLATLAPLAVWPRSTPPIGAQGRDARAPAAFGQQEGRAPATRRLGGHQASHTTPEWAESHSSRSSVALLAQQRRRGSRSLDGVFRAADRACVLRAVHARITTTQWHRPAHWQGTVLDPAARQRNADRFAEVAHVAKGVRKPATSRQGPHHVPSHVLPLRAGPWAGPPPPHQGPPDVPPL